jgi:hypothetical protein
MILDQVILAIEVTLVLITLLGVIYDFSRSYIVTGTTVPSV